jgi:hypothetical protein
MATELVPWNECQSLVRFRVFAESGVDPLLESGLVMEDMCVHMLDVPLHRLLSKQDGSANPQSSGSQSEIDEWFDLQFPSPQHQQTAHFTSSSSSSSVVATLPCASLHVRLQLLLRDESTPISEDEVEVSEALTSAILRTQLVKLPVKSNDKKSGAISSSPNGSDSSSLTSNADTSQTESSSPKQGSDQNSTSVSTGGSGSSILSSGEVTEMSRRSDHHHHHQNLVSAVNGGRLNHAMNEQVIELLPTGRFEVDDGGEGDEAGGGAISTILGMKETAGFVQNGLGDAIDFVEKYIVRKWPPPLFCFFFF